MAGRTPRMGDSDSEELEWDPDRERALRKIDRAARERNGNSGPKKSIAERKAEYQKWRAAREMAAQASTVSFMAAAAARRREQQQQPTPAEDGEGDDEDEEDHDDASLSQSSEDEDFEEKEEGEAYDVVVVGAEPAGLLLALDLGRQKLRVLLLEASASDPPASFVGGAHLNCCTMEAFRRRGLLASMLRWGLPAWRGRGVAALAGESASNATVSMDAPAPSRQDSESVGVDVAAEARTGGAAHASCQPHVLPQACQLRTLWEALAQCETVRVLRGWRVAHLLQASGSPLLPPPPHPHPRYPLPPLPPPPCSPPPSAPLPVPSTPQRPPPPPPTPRLRLRLPLHRTTGASPRPSRPPPPPPPTPPPRPPLLPPRSPSRRSGAPRGAATRRAARTRARRAAAAAAGAARHELRAFTSWAATGRRRACASCCGCR